MPEERKHSMENVYTRLATVEADVAGLSEKVDAGFRGVESSQHEIRDQLARLGQTTQVPYLPIAALVVSIIIPAMFAFSAVETLRSQYAQVQLDNVKEIQIEHRTQIKDIIGGLVNHGTEMRERVSILEGSDRNHKSVN